MQNNSLQLFQAQYYAYELTRRFASGDDERLNSSLFDAKVSLTPHQIEAALFAFKSPLSKGAILADEVGLGKTIEAGILLSQFWAENKRKIIIICPKTLRKQWSQELLDKFFLESRIVSTQEDIKEYIINKNKKKKEIIICGYEFVSNNHNHFKQPWDIVVIDEAHRLRNIYKKSMTTANRIQEAFSGIRKVLLTATPLQNSSLELYGLVSIIDDQIFGTKEAFREAYIKNSTENSLKDLQKKLSTVAIRHLRKNVQEYVNYTNRKSRTITFTPTNEEQELYNAVERYLKKASEFVIPKQVRHLMLNNVLKYLASSSFAVTQTLENFIKRLENILKSDNILSLMGNENTSSILKTLDIDLDGLDDEIEDDENIHNESITLSEEEIREQIHLELHELQECYNLAKSITTNAKSNRLLTLIDEGFDLLDTKANKKVIIFTESVRTQMHLFEVLSTKYPNKIVLFNGPNDHESCNIIYNNWFEKNKNKDVTRYNKATNIRTALVEHFRDDAVIMIATEAASEGINLQFCSLLINYDLPWNPQRIEQRIGRCHRYGQEHDVVVLNFLNELNEVDCRAYEILQTKFQLFDGVFGASDEILGSLLANERSFETLRFEIWETCRNKEEIKKAFDDLQLKQFNIIEEKTEEVKQKFELFFDSDVTKKLQTRVDKHKQYIDDYSNWLWKITKYKLHPYANFDDKAWSFNLHTIPTKDLTVSVNETFILNHQKNINNDTVYRKNHSLAQWILETIKKEEISSLNVTFSLKQNVHALETLRNQNGWLSVNFVSMDYKGNTETTEASDFLVVFGKKNNGEVLTDDEGYKLIDQFVEEATENNLTIPQEELEPLQKNSYQQLLDKIKMNSDIFYEDERNKLKEWERSVAYDYKIKERDLEKEIEDLEKLRKNLNGEEKYNIDDKIEAIKRKKKKLNQQREEDLDKVDFDIRSNLKIARQKLEPTQTAKNLFTLHWKLK